MQSKRRDLHHTRLHRETNEENLALIVKIVSSCFDRPSKPELFVPQLDFPFLNFLLLYLSSSRETD